MIKAKLIFPSFLMKRGKNLRDREYIDTEEEMNRL